MHSVCSGRRHREQVASLGPLLVSLAVQGEMREMSEDVQVAFLAGFKVYCNVFINQSSFQSHCDR